jgi:hypothetical protein
VNELLSVGPVAVAQQTPLAVISAPPLAVIFPPVTADDKVIEVTSTVVSVGTTIATVVNDTSDPYAVPTLLVAYALT